MRPDIDWNNVIKREARGNNGDGLGEVQDTTNGRVLVQRGIISKEKFYNPQDYAEINDDNVL